MASCADSTRRVGAVMVLIDGEGGAAVAVSVEDDVTVGAVVLRFSARYDRYEGAGAWIGCCDCEASLVVDSVWPVQRSTKS